MLRYKLFLALLLSALLNGATAQTNNAKKENRQTARKAIVADPLLCDPKTGICARPGYTANVNAKTKKPAQKLRVLYFTDPICSSCWGIEPQLRRLKLEYGNDVTIELHMGGLLKDWSYNAGGISKPSDVAHHWDEASKYYDMPIDGNIWLEDPLASSYPPSIAFKAAQLQSQAKAVTFLRELREMVFLRKKNIARWEHIAAAAVHTGLDTAQMKKDIDGRAKKLFGEDLQLSRQYGVTGFPTLIFFNSAGEKETIVGSNPYAVYEAAILKNFPAAKKTAYKKDWRVLFASYHSLTAKEYAELSGIPRADCDNTLDKQVQAGALEKINTKNGALWTTKREG